MAKFAEVEKFQSKKLDEASSAAGTDKENRESNAALTEEELQQALHVDPNVVPVNAEVPQENVRRRTGKLVENLEAHKQNGYETLTDYIACQIDQDEAEKVTAKEKLVLAKIRYDEDPNEPVRVPKELGKDLLEAELLGIDAYTFAQVSRHSPYSGVTPPSPPSEQGREDIPGADTKRSRDGRIYPGREPIGAGTGGYTRGGNQSEQGPPHDHDCPFYHHLHHTLPANTLRRLRYQTLHVPEHEH
eukprot:1195591-Prorocentrum_minimum.AAC.4